ncbi:MAG: hypothetical protein J6B79_04525 [Clostridia bacterium]|nr:hypothetical protein [Clostridia bacterium]
MEKKKRKNRKPLIVVAMLLMVALVVGMGAMTYSRYVSSFNSDVQQATAAKWGFVVNANANNLFGTQYKGTTLATVNGSGDVVVKANSSPATNIVAPGTTGYITINITGVAEVKAELTVTATDVAEIAYLDYKPVVWTLYNDTTPVVENTTLADALSKIEGTEIPAGTPADYKYKLEWKWVLGDAGNTTNNIKDTIIGIKASGADYDDVADTLLADGTKLSTKVTSEGDYTDDIQTVLKFNLSIKLEQVQ